MARAANPLLLIVRFRLLVLARAVGRHWFTVFVLGPMIVAGFAFILEPTVVKISGWLRAAAANWGPGEAAAGGCLIGGALLAGGMASAVRETFAVRTPEEALDALPAPASARFHGVLLAQVAHNVPAVALLWAGLSAASAAPVSAWSAAAIAAQAATAQVLAALCLARLGRLRSAGWAAPAAAGALAAWAALQSGVPSAALLVPPGYEAAQALARTLDVAWTPSPWAAPLTIGALYGLAWAAYAAWRDEHREHALEAAERRVLFPGLSHRLAGRMGRPRAAMFTRDLRLALRGFSPAVAVAAAAAVLFELTALSAWLNDWVPERWLPALALVCLSLACLSLSAVAPLLLAFQAPYFWIERSCGTEPEPLWRTKKSVALTLSAPALLATALMGPLIRPSMLDAAMFAGLAVLVWLTVGAFIGSMAFEIAPSPALGLLLSGLIASAVAGLYAVVPEYWLLWLYFYYAISRAAGSRAETTAAALGVEA